MFPGHRLPEFFGSAPASADRLEQNLGDNPWSSPGRPSHARKMLGEVFAWGGNDWHPAVTWFPPAQIARKSPWSLGIFRYLGLMKKDKCDVFYIINMAESEAQEVGLSLGGYDEEFINAVEDDLQCTICHLPLKDPMLTKCGHRCCKKCLDEHFKR